MRTPLRGSTDEHLSHHRRGFKQLPSNSRSKQLCIRALGDVRAGVAEELADGFQSHSSVMRSLPKVRLKVCGLMDERFSPELGRGHPRAVRALCIQESTVFMSA
jgi:hypothetical protein